MYFGWIIAGLEFWGPGFEMLAETTQTGLGTPGE